MSSSQDAHLYGTRPASRTKTKQISSTSSLAFSSQLSGLIKSASSENSKAPTAGRQRTKKENIFSTHNKGVKKRALKDLEESAFTQKHRGRTAGEVAEDEATWRRTKRRMEEKARLYNALKRGDIADEDEKYGVDFDTKWAEAQENGDKESESESESESNASDEELIDYIDEFGRTRKGTRMQIAREEMKKKMANVEPDRYTAQPVAPENVIYGDTIQTNAFNPEETIAQQMAELAAKRDKELTPPPEEHFDGRKEARQRGTGFMYFSKDEEERKEQMANLEKQRKETEKNRTEKAKEARQKAIDERRKLVEQKRQEIQKKRAKVKADRFLDSLGVEMQGETEKQEEHE
ncbi:hypothetical protein EJ04DRAFT_435865 [Polyplosphaeria fusca]|uniref:Coiled-coil domain-containing protein 174 n=1 Tax=Polyplosphaeria fusca TaxID=682080 RepID=A0A9P4V091_9PLEO|nr:hypothetical protein EJ04DRAFT_435865 [Polyplosphaeria fusca]